MILYHAFSSLISVFKHVQKFYLFYINIHTDSETFLMVISFFWRVLSWTSLYICTLGNSVCLLKKLLIDSVLRTLTAEKGFFFFPLRKAGTKFWCCCWLSSAQGKKYCWIAFPREGSILHSQPRACFFSCISNWIPDFSLSRLEKRWLCKHPVAFSEELYHSLEDVRTSQNTLVSMTLQVSWYGITVSSVKCSWLQ